MPIEEYRYIDIDNKIVTKADIQRLANELYSIYKKGRDNSREIEFEVFCAENVIFRSKDPGIFSDDSPVASKRVVKVGMKFVNKAGLIRVELEHGGGSSSDNHIVVTGDDSNWVNGTLKKLEEIVDSFSPQSDFIRRYEGILYIVFALTFGLAIFNVASLLADWARRFDTVPVPQSGMRDFVRYMLSNRVTVFLFLGMKYSAALIAGFYPATYLMSWLKSLFPRVELQIGAEHKLIEKQRRIRLTNFISATGVVALLMQILVDVIRGAF